MKINGKNIFLKSEENSFSCQRTKSTYFLATDEENYVSPSAVKKGCLRLQFAILGFASDCNLRTIWAAGGKGGRLKTYMFFNKTLYNL